MDPDQALRLANALKSKKLCLVLGAGVSMGASLPSWVKLIERMFDSLSAVTKGATTSTDFPEVMRAFGGAANLILGNSLMHYLGAGFADALRAALYKDAPIETDLLKTIKRMAMPGRNGAMLDSIISFNFDDLVEKVLGTDVEHVAVHDHGLEVPSDALAIYHVHGFVPQVRDKSIRSNIVFSEESYHDQFRDSFSWSNLVQLNKYINKTCLFIGLSLTDPNLRRLLDAANRRERKRPPQHFIVLKRWSPSAPASSVDHMRATDATSLGLSVIWVDDYTDIPRILGDVRKRSSKDS